MSLILPVVLVLVVVLVLDSSRPGGVSILAAASAALAAPPDLAPQETLEKGPLKATENGVACYGVACEFEGKTLVKHTTVRQGQP